MKYNAPIAIAVVLLLAVMSAGCLGSSNVGAVKVTVVGTNVDVDVLVVIDGPGYNYTYDLVVRKDSTLERILEDVPVGTYHVTLYYHDILQERRIVEVFGGETAEASFTILGV